ncbi:Aste57867_15068 [Aphanomyces stellatus]|uniref:Aste57867_15068 protein n=1 Tax=Aphanomyces stellatus TaxID=120398 RepID=A0A485L350_9STRA|nr:hypothetical protein As57867_015012 [Aphanomyces stellatus]VFT91881.1 Aste57867_15068 [Aphanomyces stellatus]
MLQQRRRSWRSCSLTHMLLFLSTYLSTAAAEWGPIQDSVYYIGNDIAVSHPHTDIDSCQHACLGTPGCVVVVWIPHADGTCLLKSHPGVAAPMANAKAVALLHRPSPMQPSSTRTAPAPSWPRSSSMTVQAASFGQMTYHYVPRAMWVNTIPPRYFTHALNRTEDVFRTEYLNHPKDDLLTPFVTVESVGECADVARTNRRTFFTYINRTQACVAHVFGGTPSRVTVASSSSMSIQTLPLPVGTVVASYHATTTASCHDDCVHDRLCVMSSVIKSNCTLMAPLGAPTDDVYAGWVVDPVTVYERDGLNIATTAATTLASGHIDVIDRIPNVTSVGDCCAHLVRHDQQFFVYDASNQACTLLTIQSAAETSEVTSYLAIAESLVEPRPLPRLLLPVDPTRLQDLPSDTTQAACQRACQPTLHQCFGSVFDAADHSCRLYLAASSSSIDVPSHANHTFGWLALSALPMSIDDAAVDTVHVFGTAHQDDHELFMSADVVAALQSPTTKVVFIYITAGDAAETNGWWEARELGTLAATKKMIHAAGRFDSMQARTKVVVSNKTITKVVLGNAVHYFMRIGEDRLMDLFMGVPHIHASAVDNPLDLYTTLIEIEGVVTALMELEVAASRPPTIRLGASEFKNFRPGDEQVDHQLHMWTGNLMANVVARHPLWSACVDQTYYFGYQRWLDLVNMEEHARLLQRSAWLRLSNAINGVYKACYPVWFDHAQHLGRQYVARHEPRQRPCNDKIDEA